MLHNHLVRVQPSHGHKASCPGTTSQGDRIRERPNSDWWRISETKVSQHNSIPYWDESTVRSLSFPARLRTVLQSILQTAGTRTPRARVAFRIQKPKPQASIQNKTEKFHKLFDAYNTIHTIWWWLGSCDGNVTAATNKTHNPTLTVWF